MASSFEMQDLLHLGSKRLELGSQRVDDRNIVRLLAVTLLGFDTMGSLFRPETGTFDDAICSRQSSRIPRRGAGEYGQHRRRHGQGHRLDV